MTQNPEKIRFLINSFLMKKKYFYMKCFLEERSISLLSIALLFSVNGPPEKTWRTFACPISLSDLRWSQGWFFLFLENICCFCSYLCIASRWARTPKEPGNERIRSRQICCQNLSSQLWKTKKLEQEEIGKAAKAEFFFPENFKVLVNT